jgi:putative SbcD/Mre11-related phosphoesterase
MVPIEILPGIICDDLFLYLKESKTFILSDVHIGYEESLNSRGVLIPRTNYDDLLVRLNKSFSRIKLIGPIHKIIINGDLIHEFGKISKHEKNLVEKLLAFLSSQALVVIIEGNHDAMLKHVIGKDFNIVNRLVLGDILITHGDKLLKDFELKKIKTIIMGHEHPAVGISSGLRLEKYKCFLKGKFERKNIVVMPSSNLLIEGTDLLRDNLLSPYLNKSTIFNFEAYVVGDEIYNFGKLKDILTKL